MPTENFDAVVVGGGHNGLITAIYLARAGWEPMVLERNTEVGGAVRSDEVTEDGFVHDLYATNQNLFLGSPVWEELADDLRRHGLSFAHSKKPFCNVFPNGIALRVFQDQKRTLEELSAHHAGDAKGWEALDERYEAFAEHLLPLLTQPLPSATAARTLGDAFWDLGFTETVDLLGTILRSTRELGDAYFTTDEARSLLAPWGMHLDFGPDVSGGAMFPLLESFTNVRVGISIVEGGASNLVEALAALVEEYGGEVRTASEVTRIITAGSSAVGVELSTGDRIQAERAVVANLTPAVLYDKLLSKTDLPASFRQSVDQYQYGPGTMMLHLALEDLPDWTAGDDIREFAYVHIGPYVDEMAQTYTDAVNGQLPREPLLIVGQTTAVDPSRTPDDQHILWVQVRTLPNDIEGDAAGEITVTDWDEAGEQYADRVLEKLEEYAPGIRELIIDRVVFTPADLEARNPNLIGGDSVSGSHHLGQNFLWRPFAGWSRYRTPIDNLYVCGASTWPGAGVNGASGYLLAQQLTEPTTLGGRLRERALTQAVRLGDELL